MAGLTPAEQAFFESGGDTSKLDPAIEATPPGDVANAGLANVDPPAPPPVAPVVVPPASPVVPDADALLRTTLASTQQQAANLQAELEAIRNVRATAAPVVPAPDPNTDPLGNMLHQLDQVNKNVADLQTKLLDQQNQQTQVQAFNRFQTQVTNLRDEFAKTTPDFQVAYEHLRAARSADLRAYGITEADITKQLFNEEFILSQAAISQAKNPAAELYEMAKRHGYKASATPAAPAVDATAAKIAALKASVAAAPPALPKSQGIEEITIDSLREASDADLNKLITDPAAWAKIAGKDNIPI